MSDVVVYADGACSGNPGPMAIGASIQDELGAELGIVSAMIGHGTNNIAEYRSAIEGLKQAKTLGGVEVELRMDSELVIRQINGVYKVRNRTLQPLHAEVLGLLKSFKTWQAVHVFREQNSRADELANLAYQGPGQPSLEE